MVRTIVKNSGETYDWVTGERALKDALTQTLFNCREEALWNCTTDNALANSRPSLSHGLNSIQTSPNWP